MTIEEIRNKYKVRDGYWFSPKRFGLGATPVTWQGWALTLGFAALLIIAMRLLPNPTEKLLTSLALLAAFVAICIGKTDGGWRWRWGRGTDR
jgi:hypothetical protein